MSEGECNEPMFKVCIVGDSQTGKSSFLKKLVRGIFSANYSSTVGCDFASKVKGMQLWDIGGKEYLYETYTASLPIDEQESYKKSKERFFINYYKDAM